MSRIAVLNAGSATLKGAVVEVDGVKVRTSLRRSRPLATRDRAEEDFDALLEELLADLPPSAIDGFAHRVVHGGAGLQESVYVDAGVEATIEELCVAAPLHNPLALAGIRAARRRAPACPQLAVFDTAFHAGREPASFAYPLPAALCEELGLRRTGFHGIAHAALMEALAAAEGIASREVTAVTLQLGGGCSACAISQGRSIETSMGLSPLGGLPMGTRSGDLDPAVVLALVRHAGDPDEVERLLTHESGLEGLCGSSDMRDVLAAEARGDERAALAVAVFVRSLVCSIGAYLTLLSGEGAIVFGGGIGAGSSEIRARVAEGLGVFGVALDEARNRRLPYGRISREGTRPVFVFETDEEQLIAREADSLLRGEGRRR